MRPNNYNPAKSKTNRYRRLRFPALLALVSIQDWFAQNSKKGGPAKSLCRAASLRLSHLMPYISSAPLELYK